METEKKRRGRPRKEKKEEVEVTEKVEKKKRGRPAKMRREERGRVGMDEISYLLKIVRDRWKEEEKNEMK